MILVDTDVLIDYKRAKAKEQSWLVNLSGQYEIAVSVITAFELLREQNQAEDLEPVLKRQVLFLPS